MVKLLVVEDHPLVREGLVHALRQLAELDLEIFEAVDCDGAREILERSRQVDLVLLDLGLPGVDGLTCLKSIRQRFPSMPVVILSAYDDPHTVSKAMKCGASGFVSKAHSSDRLLSVLREVLCGQISPSGFACAGVQAPSSFVVTPHPLSGDGDTDPSDFGLTERQAEVLGLMVRGRSNREIAGLLGLSEWTVKIHLTAVFKVLGVSSRTQAMVVVAQRGIRLS